MCKTGGPRCPKEAKRALESAHADYKANPKDVKAKNLYIQRLEQYHLTREGLDSLKTALASISDGKKDDPHRKALSQRIDRLEWKRARLTEASTIQTHIDKRVEDLTATHPDAPEIYDSLLEEGSPYAHPSRSTVSAWMERNGYSGDPIPFRGDQFYAYRNLARRCQHHELIASASGVTEIDPPRSQEESYPRDPWGNISEVYYASYGSNMNRARFMSYVEGGSTPGTTRIYPGCFDRTPPADDIAVKFNNPIFYAMNSSVWSGGVAFLDPTVEGESLGRAYLISSYQFTDVVTQESGMTPKPDDYMDINEVVERGTSPHDVKAYGTLVHVGDYNGRPVVTFTSKFNREDAIYGDQRFHSKSTGKPGKGVKFLSNSPSGAYMRMIGKGLQETFGFTPEQQSIYFTGASGGSYLSRKTVMKRLLEPEPPKKTAEYDVKGRSFSQRSYVIGNPKGSISKLPGKTYSTKKPSSTPVFSDSSPSTKKAPEKKVTQKTSAPAARKSTPAPRADSLNAPSLRRYDQY